MTQMDDWNYRLRNCGFWAALQPDLKVWIYKHGDSSPMFKIDDIFVMEGAVRAFEHCRVYAIERAQK